MAKKRIEDRETCSCGRRAGFKTVGKTDDGFKIIKCRACGKEKPVSAEVTYSYEVTKGILRSGGLK